MSQPKHIPESHHMTAGPGVGLPARPGALKAAVMAFLRPMAAYPQRLPGALRGLSAAVVTEAGDEPPPGARKAKRFAAMSTPHLAGRPVRSQTPQS